MNSWGQARWMTWIDGEVRKLSNPTVQGSVGFFNICDRNVLTEIIFKVVLQTYLYIPKNTSVLGS